MPTQLLATGMILKNRYVVGSRLGAGNFGEVFKGYDNKNKKNVALKTVAAINLAEEKEDESALGEARILQLLKDCEGVPILFDFFSYRHHNVLVMELFKMDFQHLLRNHPKKSFSKQSLLHFARHALIVIQKIHQFGFIHRDLKPANFFLPFQQTNTLKLTIGDFGMSVKFETGGMKNRGMRIRVPSKDFGFASSPYHSLGMARGRAAQECDDIEMLSGMLMACRGIRPLVGKPAEMTAKKEEIHRNPGTVVKGGNSWMKRLVELMMSQPYGATPDYQSIHDEIDHLSTIAISDDFEVVRKPDGTYFLKDL
ncbi:unnamed protein product [Caenorhabditis brenneri]